jgi:hypothetical protein
MTKKRRRIRQLIVRGPSDAEIGTYLAHIGGLIEQGYLAGEIGPCKWYIKDEDNT